MQINNGVQFLNPLSDLLKIENQSRIELLWILNHLTIARKSGRVKNQLIDDCIKKLENILNDKQKSLL